MRTKSIAIFPVVALVPALAIAEEKRELDAHEHGSGALNIAVEGNSVAMELEVPGADIVGFEYQAKSDADKAAVETALSDLGNPLQLFVLPDAAGCSVVVAKVEVVTEEDEHDDHDHGDDGHDDHADEGHDDHADEGHDDQADEDHADKGHDDHSHEHDHDEHAEDEAGHNEFHAEYALTCTDPKQINSITFAYFERFEGAQELDLQVVTDTGAQGFEVERDAPVLDMSGMF